MAYSLRRRKSLLGKPEGKGLLGRSRHRWGIILKRIFKDEMCRAWNDKF
jgi:hypothetical protein